MSALERSPFFRRSARAIAAAVSVLLVASWLLESIDVFQERRERIQDGLNDVTNLTNVLREHTRINLRVIAQGLDGLATTITPARINDPAAAAEIHTVLQRRRVATPGIVQFTISNADGLLVHTSEMADPPRLDVNAQPEFARIKQGRPSEIFITPTIRGEFGAAVGKFIFVVSRRIESLDGDFAGALHAAVSLDEFSAIAKSLTLGPNSAVGMFHLDGTLMMREPQQDDMIGRNFASSPFMKAVLANPAQGMVENLTRPDNAFGVASGMRYQAYARIAETPLIVYVAAAENDILAPWRLSVVNTIIEQSLLTLLVGFLTLYAFNALSRRTVAEADAEKARADVAQVFTATSDGIVIFDPDLRYSYVNDSFCRIAAISRESVIGKTITDRLPDEARVRNLLEKCRSSGQAVTFQDSFKAADGVEKLIEVRAFPVDDNIACVVRDMSDARAAERLRADLQQAFANTSDGIIVLDEDWRPSYVNDAYEQIFSIKRADVLGRSLWDIITGENLKIAKASFERCRAENRMVAHEENFMSPQGRRWIEVRAYPLERGIVSYIRDVSDRREAERKLMEAQRMDAVGRLTGGLAHDFNNMLAVVLGNIEMLLARLTEHSQVRSAELIRSAALRGADMVSRLLSFARRQPLDPKPVDIAAAVRDVQSLLRRTLPENIAFEFVAGAGLWLANADIAQLENVMVNLVINARDALPEGGKVTIEASNAHLDHSYAADAEVPPGQYVLLAVSDTGTGMTADVAAKAFEPFFTTKPVGKGTGLGLSMVYGFARQSGGHVRLYSEPGQGTTVKLYLPRAQGVSSLTTSNVQVPQAPGGNETILLVEDEDMVREFVQTLLIDLGYRVVAHSGADGALAEINAGLTPDLLLTDLMLTGLINGRRLAETIVQLRPGLKVLYMSGYTENAIVHHGRLDPGVHLISKPFRRHDLAIKIRRILSEMPRDGMARG